MTRRHYKSESPVVTLTGPIDSAVTNVPLSSLTGMPAVFPYTAEIDGNTASAEIILVTSVIGTTATVTRGYDGTSGQSHNAGATFQHVAVSLDFDEANSHVNATSAVHGVAGALVGATSTQTVTNKTFNNNTFTAGSGIVGVDVSATVDGDLAIRSRKGAGANQFTVTGNGAVTATSLTTPAASIATLTTTTGNITVVGATTIVATGNITAAGTIQAGGTLIANGGLTVKGTAPSLYKECLSTTRPATPSTGDLIYETDTRQRYRWDGTTWQLRSFLYYFNPGRIAGGIAIPGHAPDPTFDPYIQYGTLSPGLEVTTVEGSITAAPAGLYEICCAQMTQCDSGTGITRGYSSLWAKSGTADEAFIELYMRADRDQSVGVTSYTRHYDHPGGDLLLSLKLKQEGSATMRAFNWGTYMQVRLVV